jgi:hypothetical protein
MWWWETVARGGGLLISEDATSSMLTVHMGPGQGFLEAVELGINGERD